LCFGRACCCRSGSNGFCNGYGLIGRFSRLLRMADVDEPLLKLDNSVGGYGGGVKSSSDGESDTGDEDEDVLPSPTKHLSRDPSGNLGNTEDVLPSISSVGYELGWNDPRVGGRSGRLGLRAPLLGATAAAKRMSPDRPRTRPRTLRLQGPIGVGITSLTPNRKGSLIAASAEARQAAVLMSNRIKMDPRSSDPRIEVLRELSGRIRRIYLLGNNTPFMPWKLPELPQNLRVHIKGDEYEVFRGEVAQIGKWRAWEEWLLAALVICPPARLPVVRWLQAERLQRLRNYVDVTYDGAFIRSVRVRALAGTLKCGWGGSSLELAFVDVYHVRSEAAGVGGGGVSGSNSGQQVVGGGGSGRDSPVAGAPAARGNVLLQPQPRSLLSHRACVARSLGLEVGGSEGGGGGGGNGAGCLESVDGLFTSRGPMSRRPSDPLLGRAPHVSVREDSEEPLDPMSAGPPLVVLCGGDGTYWSPWSLDSADILVASIFSAALGSQWAAGIANLNALLWRLDRRAPAPHAARVMRELIRTLDKLQCAQLSPGDGNAGSGDKQSSLDGTGVDADTGGAQPEAPCRLRLARFMLEPRTGHFKLGLVATSQNSKQAAAALPFGGVDLHDPNKDQLESWLGVRRRYSASVLVISQAVGWLLFHNKPLRVGQRVGLRAVVLMVGILIGCEVLLLFLLLTELWQIDMAVLHAFLLFPPCACLFSPALGVLALLRPKDEMVARTFAAANALSLLSALVAAIAGILVVFPLFEDKSWVLLPFVLLLTKLVLSEAIHVHVACAGHAALRRRLPLEEQRRLLRGALEPGAVSEFDELSASAWRSAAYEAVDAQLARNA